MIGARFEPPPLWMLAARTRDLERERLRRCLTLAEELELARLRGQQERMTERVTERVTEAHAILAALTATLKETP